MYGMAETCPSWLTQERVGDKEQLIQTWTGPRFRRCSGAKSVCNKLLGEVTYVV